MQVPLFNKAFPFLRGLSSSLVFHKLLNATLPRVGGRSWASADPRRSREPRPVAGGVSSSDPKDGGRQRLLGWGGERAAESLPGEGRPQVSFVPSHCT